MSCCRKEESRTPSVTYVHARDIIIVGSHSPQGAYVVLGLSDHVFLPDFSYLEQPGSTSRLVVTSGPGFCAARLGAPVRGAQEIANFGLKSCAVLTEIQALGPLALFCADRTESEPPRGLQRALFCASRTENRTLSNRTGNDLKSCEN